LPLYILDLSFPLSTELSLSTAASLSSISAEDWDRCAGAPNPFVSHAFLSTLEDSGAVSAATGWQPQHLVGRVGDKLVGVMPLYLKNHSYGEYVFDWNWAEAYEQAGGRYYPKLQGGIPFSPVPGPRLLLAADTSHEFRQTLIHAAESICKDLSASSVHVPFPSETDWQAFGEAGWIQRLGLQFHWHNHDYKTFDDFLATLASRKRKHIRKEREAARDSGVEFVHVTGSDLAADHWDAFYRFYLNTSDRKWGQAYLPREFFTLLGERIPERILLVLGRRNGRWVCGALNLIGDDCLYGRNWGSDEDIKFLHFEACYYQAIDFAIDRRLKRVEAGAQGPHKLARGYLPVPTYSAHFIRDENLRNPVAQFVKRERKIIERQIAELAAESPYRHSDS